jgi:hypothetical protein
MFDGFRGALLRHDGPQSTPGSLPGLYHGSVLLDQTHLLKEIQSLDIVDNKHVAQWAFDHLKDRGITQRWGFDTRHQTVINDNFCARVSTTLDLIRRSSMTIKWTETLSQWDNDQIIDIDRVLHTKGSTKNSRPTINL